MDLGDGGCGEDGGGDDKEREDESERGFGIRGHRRRKKELLFLIQSMIREWLVVQRTKVRNGIKVSRNHRRKEEEEKKKRRRRVKSSQADLLIG